jgi:hypothetical protein
MRKLLIALLFSLPLVAQPNVCQVGGTNSGCPTNAALNPTTQTWIGDVSTAYIAGVGTMNLLPQPKLSLGTGGQIVGLSDSFITSDPSNCQALGTCIYSNVGYEENYVNAIIAAGGACVDVNVLPDIWIVAAEYTGSATVPSVSRFKGFLASIDTTLLYAQSKGLCIRFSPAPTAATWTNCGVASPGTVTPANQALCLGPEYAAMVAHATAKGYTIRDFTLCHEPTARWKQTTYQLTTVQWSALIADLAPYVVGPNLGSGFTGGENAWVVYAIANNAQIVFIGVDVYFGLDDGSYNTLLANYGAFCTEAIAGSLNCAVNESAPWRHCPAGAPVCSENVAYDNCADPNLSTWNVNGAFGFLPRYFSTVGAYYVSVFSTQPWDGSSPANLVTTSSCADSSLTGLTAWILQNQTGPTPAALAWNANALWNTKIWEGFLNITAGQITIQ